MKREIVNVYIKRKFKDGIKRKIDKDEKIVFNKLLKNKSMRIYINGKRRIRKFK